VPARDRAKNNTYCSDHYKSQASGRGEWWRRSSSTLESCSPRVGFIVTNLAAQSRAVIRFFNKRGTAEKWIKEGTQAVKMTRLSCHRFCADEVRLWLR
jgi:Transposase DDE domain group 1